jgi:hydroxyacylglutathione hydrolase
MMVDVRTEQEWQTGRIDDAVSLPLSRLADGLEGLPTDRPIVVYCSSGYRSAIAASLIRREQLRDVFDLVGGIGAWESARPDAVHA